MMEEGSGMMDRGMIGYEMTRQMSRVMDNNSSFTLNILRKIASGIG